MRQSSNDRFSAKLDRRDPVTGCIPWKDGVGAAGSGRFSIKVAGGRKVVYAHRAAFALQRFGNVEREPEIKGVVVQTCGNILCCSIAHLELHSGRKGLKKRRARGPLTDFEREQILAWRSAGYSQQLVAAKLNISQTTVSRVERAEKETTSCDV